MPFRRGLAFVISAVWLCACTHLVQEQAQPVYLSSEPAGATVYVGTVPEAERTPMTVTLDPRRTHEVRFEKPCYADYITTLRPSMGGRTYGTVMIPVSQLDASVHARLHQTCEPLVVKEKR